MPPSYKQDEKAIKSICTFHLMIVINTLKHLITKNMGS